MSGTVDTPERPDEALTGPSKTGPVCCGTSTARRPHGSRGGGHQTCATGLARARSGSLGLLGRERGVTCRGGLLEPSRLPPWPSQSGEMRTRAQRTTTCQRVRGVRCVPCQILLCLPILGRGNLVGGPPRCAGTRRRRVVSLGSSVQATATEHPSGAGRARDAAVAGGACKCGAGGTDRGSRGEQPSMGRTF